VSYDFQVLLTLGSHFEVFPKTQTLGTPFKGTINQKTI